MPETPQPLAYNVTLQYDDVSDERQLAALVNQSTFCRQDIWYVH